MERAKAGRIRAGISRMLGNLAGEVFGQDAKIFSGARTN